MFTDYIYILNKCEINRNICIANKQDTFITCNL